MYAHYQSTAGNRSDGTYRVVGISDESVTLLRITDADGKRVHTGQTVTVARDSLGDYEVVDNPDETFSFEGTVSSAVEALYWTSRVFAAQLLTHRLLSSIAVALVLIGFLGDEAVPLPDFASSILVLIGTLTLVYIGNGRL
ncbi:hypothetical protein AUR64_03490 [Haloprofundus marisrubri]|uniref:Uncharacterized protein n=2 Tax=Haloprofundus marisrubri TaxID=1514971 RepID=A0A0W1RCY5_9EURY|nr:hypothetical protein AUR64_03490 [Haloprofundus marisrubri]